MFSIYKICFALAVATGSALSSAIPAPLVASAPAPVVEAPVATPFAASAHVGYTHAVPDNIAPYASQVSIVNRGFAPPYIAGPYALTSGVPVGPYAVTSGVPVGPYLGGPAPYFAPAPYVSGSYALPVGAPAALAPAPVVGPDSPFAAGPSPYAASFVARSPFVPSVPV